MKGIIFDVGNVIQNGLWDRGARMLRVPRDDYKNAFMKDRENHWDLYETDKITSFEFGSFVLGNLGIEVSEENVQLFLESVKQLWEPPNLKVVNIIRRIHPKIKKAILSNSCPELEERARSFDGTELDYLSLFRPHIYFSHNIGSRKPFREAYDHVVKRLGLRSWDCMFIDDKESNIMAANHYLLNGVSYTGPENLEKLLKPYLTA